MANQIPIGDGVLRIIADANKGIQQVQEFQKGVQGTFQKLSSAINIAGSLLFVNYAKQAVKALADIAYAAAETGAQWNKLSLQTGIAVEKLSAMNYLAIKGETDIASLADGLKFLSRNAYSAATDGGIAAKAFNKLGVSVRDSSGKIKSSHQLLVESANAFKGMTNETERTALAMEIFGRGGLAMLPMLKEGGANIQMMEQRARELGITWSTVDAEAADELTDAIEDLSLQFKAFKDNALKPLIPEMANFTAGLSAAWREVQNMSAGGKGGILQQAISAGQDIAQYYLGLNQIKGVLGEIADFGAKNKQYDADVLAATELIQKKLEEIGFIHKEINKNLDWRKGVDEHAKKLAESLKQDYADIAELEKKALEGGYASVAAMQWVETDTATKAALKSFELYQSMMALGVGQGPLAQAAPAPLIPGELTPFDVTDLSNGLDLVMPKLLNLTDIYRQLNDVKLAGVEIDKAAQQAEFNKLQAGVSGLGSLAQGMGAINENSKNMFKFQQGIQMVQGIMDAYSAWAAAGRQGGIYGFALGAAIFARIMAFVAILKSQKAPDPPKMKVPGAADGGVVFKPNIIAIAEKEPEIVMPLSRAEREGFIGGGKTQIEISFKDMADWERNIAVKLVKRARSERLEGWGFAGA